MKVLFVYSNRVRDLLPAPPIGLSYVASATEDAGHQVEFVDLLQTNKGLKLLARHLRSFRPDVVAISVRNIDNVIHQRLLTHLGELAQQTDVIRLHSSAKIVVGGPAISVLGCNALRHIDADFAVLGEGEDSFPALLEEISGGRAYWKINGVCIRGQQTLTPVEPRTSEGFGSSGMQRWVKNWRSYEQLGATWPVQCKRGCPLKCTYCTYPRIEGRAMRRRPPEEIIDEIRQIQKSIGPRCFEFIDSVFNMPENYAIELCESIIRSGLKINLTTMGVNPRFLSAELLAVMKRAGFNSLMITPESASDPVLEAMKKGSRVKMSLPVQIWCAKQVYAACGSSCWVRPEKTGRLPTKQSHLLSGISIHAACLPCLQPASGSCRAPNWRSRLLQRVMCRRTRISPNRSSISHPRYQKIGCCNG